MAPKVSLERDPIRRAIAGWQEGVDRETHYRTLVETYYRAVYGYFLRRGFGDETGDLTQEVFFGIYKGLASFRREASFETWLFQIAANTGRKALRDRGVLKRRLTAEARSMTDLPQEIAEPREPGDERPLGGLLDQERRARLRRAITGLPPQMRSCLEMRVYQELSYREIAAALRLSVETVKAHLYQARQRLQRELGDEPGGETR